MRKVCAMKKAAFIGLAISLAELPVYPPAAETIAAGAPTPLTPAPVSPSSTAPLVLPPQQPRRLRYASPARYPLPVHNPYHPHWIVQVFGR